MKWSSGLRFAMVGGLALAMFVPLLLASEVIHERADYARAATVSVGQEWGGEQTLLGPVLVIPVEGPVTRTERREAVDPATGKVDVELFEVTEIVPKKPIRVLPDRFDLTITSTSQVRRRGIFEVPVYTAQARFLVDFDVATRPLPLEEDETVLWEAAHLSLSLSSNRALRGETALTVDGRQIALEPMAAPHHGPEARTGGITAALGDPRAHDAYELVLDFNGAETLMLAPVGRHSTVAMTSDWPHPSFTGAFLPDNATIQEDGFDARWTVPHLARAMPQVSRSDYRVTAAREAFGLRFFQPNDFYQKAYRTARYGILFIGLTFLAVLLIERGSGRRTHPIQYLLTGLVQAVFALVLVAYAEQIGFTGAYALASGATVGLLAAFGYIALGLGRRTMLLGAALTLLYGVLFLILRSADYALLAGSTLAFLALAGTMYATRNERWSAEPTDKTLDSNQPPSAPSSLAATLQER